MIAVSFMVRVKSGGVRERKLEDGRQKKKTN